MLTEQQLKELERELEKLKDDMTQAIEREAESPLSFWRDRLDQVIFRKLKIK